MAGNHQTMIMLKLVSTKVLNPIVILLQIFLNRNSLGCGILSVLQVEGTYNIKESKFLSKDVSMANFLLTKEYLIFVGVDSQLTKVQFGIAFFIKICFTLKLTSKKMCGKNKISCSF